MAAPQLHRQVVHVRAPATSANLGPGFDALGLALALYDELTVRAADSGVRVQVEGEAADEVPRDATHLVVRAMHAVFAELGVTAPGLDLSCTNRIPHGRGLGSSAAAIVGGMLAARALVTGGADALPAARLLALASAFEGHPDNVAACLLGGLTIAWTEHGTARAIRVTERPPVTPVLLIAPMHSSTASVRAVLPPSVPHGDAAFTGGRVGLLVAALTGHDASPAGLTDPHVLLTATEDRLHQRYRAAAMPATAALIDRLRGDGLAAVVSGAGPSVLVLARGDVEVERIAADVAPQWRIERLAVADDGARATLGGNTPGSGGVAGRRPSV
jgi:homoserine kinase